MQKFEYGTIELHRVLFFLSFAVLALSFALRYTELEV